MFGFTQLGHLKQPRSPACITNDGQASLNFLELIRAVPDLLLGNPEPDFPDFAGFVKQMRPEPVRDFTI